ncbi:hypothetical protein [Trinickia fusca]|uniref:Uncharacterized protein n=1 Tax=Trinickia fusca TaxID=2419777 RepID=A0A494X1V0_9BURK|nr:hypothetical protein [Trinickia fusca]RKP44300.1 hypothetical protein D7S89_22480 [Trinickia fusca]
MLRFTTALVAVVACGSAYCAPASDGQAFSLATSKALTAKPTESAAPNQLFPPLPSLASLPGSGADEADDGPATPATTRHGSKKSRRGPAHKVAVVETSVRVVVSDESHTYLATVERKLDEVMQGSTREARVPTDAVSLAMTR